MKKYLLIICLLASSSLYSQVEIKGMIFDDESKEPVAGAVVYTGEYRNMTMSDDSGHFSINVRMEDTVRFRQLAYDDVSVKAEELIKNANVGLTKNVKELDEITVTPVNVEYLLNRSFQKLIDNYENENIAYLLKAEPETSAGGEREAYALIDVSRSNKKSSRSVNLNTKLMQYDITKSVNTGSFYVKKTPLSIQFIAKSIGSGTNTKNDSHYELFSRDDEHFIIKSSPAHPDKKRHSYSLYIISRSDTVLVEYIAQSLSNVDELTMKKIRGISTQITNHYEHYTFAQNEISGAYFIHSFHHLASRNIYSAQPYSHLSKITIFAVEKTDAKQLKGKTISPVDREIFQSKLPPTPGFWKKYINEIP
ncbi:MAG: carboxypeptidase-like regulatory domain-containing protein [Tannerella sp.]|jgi:hypothetical protein|nr:carboxypeptidase-like regulatory domain-containing protein [Tannerella sp.]